MEHLRDVISVLCALPGRISLALLVASAVLIAYDHHVPLKPEWVAVAYAVASASVVLLLAGAKDAVSKRRARVAEASAAEEKRKLKRDIEALQREADATIQSAEAQTRVHYHVPRLSSEEAAFLWHCVTGQHTELIGAYTNEFTQLLTAKGLLISEDVPIANRKMYRIPMPIWEHLQKQYNVDALKRRFDDADLKAALLSFHRK